MPVDIKVVNIEGVPLKDVTLIFSFEDYRVEEFITDEEGHLSRMFPCYPNKKKENLWYPIQIIASKKRYISSIAAKTKKGEFPLFEGTNLEYINRKYRITLKDNLNQIKSENDYLQSKLNEIENRKKQVDRELLLKKHEVEMQKKDITSQTGKKDSQKIEEYNTLLTIAASLIGILAAILGIRLTILQIKKEK